MAKIKNANRIQLRPDTRIGNIAAENDDKFLFECFVDNMAVLSAMDVSHPGTILCGRTGSGKTAILRYIQRHHAKSTELDPAELSISYISNSDIFRFLNDIGADLDIFFQVLWKHVLCIEYIKLKYDLTDESRYNSFINKMVSKFSTDNTKKKAIDYIKTWGSEFWINIDENVRSITERYESALSAELNVDLKKASSKAGFGRNMSREQKTEYARRAHKILDGQQLADLSRVLDLFPENSRDRPRTPTTYWSTS